MDKQDLEKYKFNFHWDAEDIWKLDYPTEDMEIKLLQWHIDCPFWNNYTLRPLDVILNPELYPEEYKAIMNTDLSYPIDIMKNLDRWVILDGLHRLTKSWITCQHKVKVRKIPRSEIPNIKK